jgi:hypothetical protein
MLKITGKIATREVFIDDVKLHPDESQKLYNHSPDGFAWGYGGSGPSQLALAIMLKCTDAKQAQRLYQDFKADIIAELPKDDDFTLWFDFEQWLEDRRK